MSWCRSGLANGGKRCWSAVVRKASSPATMWPKTLWKQKSMYLWIHVKDGFCFCVWRSVQHHCLPLGCTSDSRFLGHLCSNLLANRVENSDYFLKICKLKKNAKFWEFSLKFKSLYGRRGRVNITPPLSIPPPHLKPPEKLNWFS